MGPALMVPAPMDLHGPEHVHSSGSDSVAFQKVRWSPVIGRWLGKEIVLPLTVTVQWTVTVECFG